MEENKTSPGRRQTYIEVKSPKPIWIASLVWLICSVPFKLYTFGGLIFTAVSTLAAYLIAKKKCKPVQKLVDVPFYSGIAEIDEAVKEFDRVAGVVEKDRLVIASRNIPASKTMARIVELIEKISDSVSKDIEDLKRCRRFMNYYLPTTEKLADKYVFITGKDAGDNVNETKAAIESAFEQIEKAFRKQYDSLFENDALDITTDVAVLETMLKKDGLD